MASLQFVGGPVELPEPTIEELCGSASNWLGDASIHFSAGESLVDSLDLDEAIVQLAFAVTKINTARMRLIEARELEAMEKGS